MHTIWGSSNIHKEVKAQLLAPTNLGLRASEKCLAMSASIVGISESLGSLRVIFDQKGGEANKKKKHHQLPVLAGMSMESFQLSILGGRRVH